MLIAFYNSLVQTEGGNAAARGMGLPQAPHTKEQSANAIISLVSPNSFTPPDWNQYRRLILATLKDRGVYPREDRWEVPQRH
jgi:hypothetical protein